MNKAFFSFSDSVLFSLVLTFLLVIAVPNAEAQVNRLRYFEQQKQQQQQPTPPQRLINNPAPLPQPAPIATGRVVIIHPAPYQFLVKSTRVPIRWQAVVKGDVALYFRDKTTGRKTLIAENQASGNGQTQEIQWSIPDTLPNGEHDLILEDRTGVLTHTIQVKITGDAIKWNGFSNPDQRLDLVTPNGGESFRFGEGIRINWNHTGLGNSKLDILFGAPDSTGKIVWRHIATGVPGNWNSYTWHPGQIIREYVRQEKIKGTPKFKIMIEDPKNRNAKDTSDGYFSVN